jgi:hypothetical protein
VVLQRWGFPMRYSKDTDEEMVQSLIDCGGERLHP